jgi:hypothetical protein
MYSEEQSMDGKDKDEAPAPPPGEGEGIEQASEDAVRQMDEQQDGARNSGYGDGG